MRKAMARLVTSRVRSKVVPSGISSSTVKYPWSSVGRKLVGINLYRTKMAISTMQKPMPTRRGCLMMRLMPPRYLVLPKSTQRLMARKTRFFGLFGSTGFRMSEHITGLSVKATTVESNTEMAIVTLN